MLETISFNGLNPSFMSLHFSRDEQMSYHYWWTQNAHLLSSLYQAKTALWSIETMFKTYQRKGDNIDVAADVFFRENAILAKLTERLHPYIWLLLKSPSYNQYHHCASTGAIYLVIPVFWSIERVGVEGNFVRFRSFQASNTTVNI